jgi:hypothetical protein
MKSAIFSLAIIAVLSPVGAQPHSARRDPTVTANAWMKTPTDLSTPDVVLGILRTDRDPVWDGLIGARSALTPEEATQHGIAEGAHFATEAEIPDIPDRAVLIGRFSGFRSVLTASTRAIYTEVSVDVSNVFEDVAGHAKPGGQITIILAGGTVKTLAGQIISYLTQPRAYSIQPNKAYLLVLGYYAEGDSYGLAKDWDITDGTVKANTALDMQRAKDGKSTLVGMTKDQLINSLTGRFLPKQ